MIEDETTFSSVWHKGCNGAIENEHSTLQKRLFDVEITISDLVDELEQ